MVLSGSLESARGTGYNQYMVKNPPAISMSREAQVERASRALILASFLSSLGFNFVFPLIPLYVREISGPGPDVAIWSGLAFAATPMGGAIAAPIWGRMADRFGYRPMLIRALVCTSLIIGLMSLPTQPWHLVLLRALAGAFGAFQPVAMGALSSWNRPEELFRSIGRLQMAQVLGAVVGPTLGGGVAALYGVRLSPVVGGVVIAAGVVMVARWLHEPSGRTVRLRGADQPLRPAILWLPIVTLIAVQFTDSSFNPIVPLLLAQGTDGIGAVAGLSGAAASLSAAAAAVTSGLSGRIIRKGIQRGTVMTAIVFLAGFAAVAAMAPLPWGLILMRVLCGGTVAGLAVAAYSAGGLIVQPGQRGAAYGWLASSSMVGFAASPISAGFLAAIDLRAVLVVDSVLCLLAVAGWTQAKPVIAPSSWKDTRTIEQPKSGGAVERPAGDVGR